MAERTARLTRWAASGFFVAVAAGCAYLAWLLLHAPAADSDTAPGVWVGMGVVFAVFSLGAVIAAVWVFRHWLDRYS